MKFSALNPTLGSGPRVPEGIITWTVSFDCPLCRTRTSIEVWPQPARYPVWNISPAPLDMLNSIETAVDIQGQWNRMWDSVTIQPSIKEPPHPRQIKCLAHFSIIKGAIHFS
jgi:hypothetical protein